MCSNRAPDRATTLQAIWPDATFSPTETALLWCLLLAAGRPIDRAALLQQVWGYAHGVDSRTVETTIARIRRKIEPDPAHPIHLLTLRGRGYQLHVPRVFQAVSPFPRRQPLVGRDELLDTLRAELTHGARLLTLTGSPGIGKTALARRLLTVLADSGPVLFFADLSSALDTGAFLVSVAAALGGSPSLEGEAVGQRLAGLQPCLGVLDNLEQLPDEAARWVGRWLTAWPGVQLVATSHRPLGLEMEHVIRVGPLEQTAAIELISSVGSRRGLPLDPSAVARAVEEGGGHPLALELVAASSVGSTVPWRVDLPGRQHAMDLLVSRALSLLPAGVSGGLGPGDALVLGSMFRGPLTAEVAGLLWGVEQSTAAGLLFELADRSLLQVEAGAFAVPRALRPPLERLCARHALRGRVLERYVRWVCAETGRLDPGHFEVLLGSGAETPKLVVLATRVFEAAHRERRLVELLGSIHTSAPELQIEVRAAVASCWTTLGRLDEARNLLDDTLRLARARAGPESLWRLLLARAWNCRKQGRYDEVEAWLQEAEGLARVAGQAIGIAEVLQQRILALIDTGDLTGAGLVDEAVALYRRAGQGEMAKLIELRRGTFQLLAGDWPAARAHLEGILPDLPEPGWYDARVQLGITELVLGRLDQARDQLGAALALTLPRGGKGLIPAFGVQTLGLMEGVAGAEAALAEYLRGPATVEGRFRQAFAALVLDDRALLASGTSPELRRARVLAATLQRPLGEETLRSLFAELFRARSDRAGSL